MEQAAPEAPNREMRRLARLLTLAGRNDPRLTALPHAPAKSAEVWGVTGPPGAGKSTLIAGLVGCLRRRGERVAVLAVDPSSPRHGGALLGDRIRMQAHAQDAGVFIRSLASLGQGGGLAPGLSAMLRLVAQAGYGRIIVETVGMGQEAGAIAGCCDRCLLVLTPAAGDGVQAMKAGISELADVIVVNQAEAGVETLLRELRAGLPADRQPPILATVASEQRGIEELVQALLAPRLHKWNMGK